MATLSNGTNLDAKRISRLTLEKDIETIVALPPPEESALSTARPSELQRTAKSFLHYWLDLACNKITLQDDLPLPERALFVLVAYYDFSHRALTKLKSHKSLHEIPHPSIKHAGHLIKSLNEVEESGKFDSSKDRSEHFDSYMMRELLIMYIYCLDCCSVAWLLKHTPELGVLRSFESIAHDALSSMYGLSLSATGPLKLLSNRLIAGSLERLSEIYRTADESWNREHRIGPFSQIKLSEFPLMASRNEAMIELYGQKHLEKAFEQQLALIVQSLGFYVVSTRTGERMVDLVCMSPNPYSQATILIEAKTSKRPYALPSKDERAILEYVDEIRRSLTTFPSLQLVLIVGPRAGKTLGNKLKRLELRLGIPTRFCTAQDFAEIRESIPGPIPLNLLIEQILSSSHVLEKRLGVSIAKKYTAIQTAHSDLVRTMLDRSIPRPTQAECWPDNATKGDEPQK